MLWLGLRVQSVSLVGCVLMAGAEQLRGKDREGKAWVHGLLLKPGAVVEFGGGLSIVLEVTRVGVVLESAGGHRVWVEFGKDEDGSRVRYSYRGSLKGVTTGVVQRRFTLGSVPAFDRAERSGVDAGRRVVLGKVLPGAGYRVGCVNCRCTVLTVEGMPIAGVDVGGSA